MMQHVELDGFEFFEGAFGLFEFGGDREAGEFLEVLYAGVSPPSGVAFLDDQLLTDMLPPF